MRSLKPGIWMIGFVCFVHMWWGALILITNLGERDWHGGVSWNVFVSVGGLDFWAYAMLFCAVLAIAGLIMKNSLWSFLILLPQQFVLLVGLFGVFAAFFGVFFEFDPSRVLRVIPYTIGMTVFHTAAILDSHDLFHIWKRT